MSFADFKNASSNGTIYRTRVLNCDIEIVARRTRSEANGTILIGGLLFQFLIGMIGLSYYNGSMLSSVINILVPIGLLLLKFFRRLTSFRFVTFVKKCEARLFSDVRFLVCVFFLSLLFVLVLVWVLVKDSSTAGNCFGLSCQRNQLVEDLLMMMSGALAIVVSGFIFVSCIARMNGACGID